jgi:membrane-bound lytic murein transglycosylase B
VLTVASALLVSVAVPGEHGARPLAAQAPPDPQPAGAPEDGAPGPPPIQDPRVAPSLVAVPVDSPAYRDAVARYRDAERRLDESRSLYAASQAELVTLHEADARLVGERNEATRKRAKADGRRTELRAKVREFAVANYMAVGMGEPFDPALDLDRINELLRQRALVDTASEQHLAELAATADQVRRMDAVLAQTGADLVDVRRRLEETTAARDGAVADGSRATSDLARFGQQVADARLEAKVVGLDFTFVVLDAYVKGAERMAFERPACALRWTALAGIGRTESGHGVFGGAVVGPNGDVSRPIIGIPLDGNQNTAVITDSDGGELDGDVEYDRAVGPMQFIPTSWRGLGRDGNGDGRADPQNMYDAALAAAGLLCRGRTLDSDAGLRAAFLSYNNSNAYASLVLERTHAYDLFVIPPPL